MSRVAMISSIGPETHYTRQLYEALWRSGCDVTLLAEAGEATEQYGQSLRGAKVVGLWSRDLSLPRMLKCWCRANGVQTVHLQHEFNMYHRNYYFGCVIFLLSLAALRFVGMRVIVTVHAVISPSQLHDREMNIFGLGSGLLSRMLCGSLFRLFYGLIRMLSHVTVVHTEYSRQILCRDYAFRRTRCVMIPHGIRDRQISEMPQQGEERIISTFGYIVRRKGIEVLIHAFKKLHDRNRDLRLVIGGAALDPDDLYLDELKKIVVSLALEGAVTFPGFLSQKELEELISRSSILVICHRVSVSSSGALALAIGSGRPIVVADQPTIREALSVHGGAILYRSEDAADLADKIERVLLDVTLRSTLSAGAKEIAALHSWERIAARHAAELYRCG